MQLRSRIVWTVNDHKEELLHDEGLVLHPHYVGWSVGKHFVERDTPLDMPPLPDAYHDDPEVLQNRDKILSKTHDSGWTIRARVMTSWYAWIDDFEADHDYYGHLEGSFSKVVKGYSKDALKHFMDHHPFSNFCYGLL